VALPTFVVSHIIAPAENTLSARLSHSQAAERFAGDAVNVLFTVAARVTSRVVCHADAAEAVGIAELPVSSTAHSTAATAVAASHGATSVTASTARIWIRVVRII